VKVSVPSTSDVSDLIKVIKGELSPKLDAIAVDEIYLHRPQEEDRKEGGEYKDEEETAYEPDVLVSAILQEGVGQTSRKAILIRTTAQQGILNLTPRSIKLYYTLYNIQVMS